MEAGITKTVHSLSSQGLAPDEVTYVYDGDDLIQERRVASTKEFVHGVGPDEPLMMINNGRYYYHYDALGSVIALTNAEGQVVEGYAYDAYGVPTFVADGGDGVMEWGWGDEAVIPPRHWPSPVSGIGSLYGNPFLFTGQVYDPETSDYYYKARYYDPHNARFLSRDPVGTWTDWNNLGNAYAYVGNNPAMFTDPTGEFAWVLGGAAIGCAAGGVAGLVTGSGGFWSKDRWSRAGKGCLVGGAAGALISTGVGALATGAPFTAMAGGVVGTRVLGAAGSVMLRAGFDCMDGQCMEDSLYGYALTGVAGAAFLSPFGSLGLRMGWGAGAIGIPNFAEQRFDILSGRRCDMNWLELGASTVLGALGGAATKLKIPGVNQGTQPGGGHWSHVRATSEARYASGNIAGVSVATNAKILGSVLVPEYATMAAAQGGAYLSAYIMDDIGCPQH